MVILYTTDSCVNCPRVKNFIFSDPDLKDKVEVRKANEHMDECVKYGVRAVPTLLINETPYHVAGSSEKEIKELILGEK